MSRGVCIRARLQSDTADPMALPAAAMYYLHELWEGPANAGRAAAQERRTSNPLVIVQKGRERIGGQTSLQQRQCRAAPKGRGCGLSNNAPLLVVVCVEEGAMAGGTGQLQRHTMHAVTDEYNRMSAEPNTCSGVDRQACTRAGCISTSSKVS